MIQVIERAASKCHVCGETWIVISNSPLLDAHKLTETQRTIHMRFNHNG